MSDEEIVRSCLGAFEEEDPDEEAVWHFTDDEVRRLILLAIEAAEERAGACPSRLTGGER